MSVVLAVIAGGIGALVRAEVTELRGRREGTALVNLAGAALLGLIVGLAGAEDASASAVLIPGVGFCGGLTTYSTWMLDVASRREDLHALSIVVTLGVGAALAGAGWFLGALLD